MAYPAIRSDLEALVRSDFIRLVTRGVSSSDCLSLSSESAVGLRISDSPSAFGESLLGAAGLGIFGFGIGVPLALIAAPISDAGLGDLSDLLDSACGLGLRIL